MIRRAVRIDLLVFSFVLLDVGERIENDEQSDDYYERQNDGESLAHRQLASALQGCEIAGAKILPVSWSCLRKTVPVALEAIGESSHSRIKLRNTSQRVQIIAIGFMLGQANQSPIAEFDEQCDVGFANRRA